MVVRFFQRFSCLINSFIQREWLGHHGAPKLRGPSPGFREFPGRELLEGMIAGVLGGTVDPTSPLANPLHADFTGFPRLYMTAGSVESLLDNATRVGERAKAAGVDVTVSIGEGQQHVYPFLAGRSELVAREFEKLAAWHRN